MRFIGPVRQAPGMSIRSVKRHRGTAYGMEAHGSLPRDTAQIRTRLAWATLRFRCQTATDTAMTTLTLLMVLILTVILAHEASASTRPTTRAGADLASDATSMSSDRSGQLHTLDGTSTSATRPGSLFPGPVRCVTADVTTAAPYFWQCTHADGTPVRWATKTIGVWAAGLPPVQVDALNGAVSQWSRYTGIATRPASSPTDAQLLVTQVSELGADSHLGSGVIRYAFTACRESNGYYENGTIEVAKLPGFGYAEWLDIFLHELGHVAGLAHVADIDQVMRPVLGVPSSTYGAGDIAGLEQLRPI